MADFSGFFRKIKAGDYKRKAAKSAGKSLASRQDQSQKAINERRKRRQAKTGK